MKNLLHYLRVTAGTCALLLATMTFTSHAQSDNNVTLCHNGTTISVGPNAVQAHLDHGDVLGSCDGCVDPSLIDVEIFCLQIYDPVCGCDGNTYSNACVATYQNGITSFTNGECGCIGEPLDILCPTVYDPVCGCDGETYSNSCFATAAGVTSYTQGACGGVIIDKSNTTADNKISTELEAYPNPATEQATIRFSVAESTHVNVEVYDITGKLVTTLFSGDATSEKVYSITFDSSELDNGTYILRMTTESGESTSSKLMIAR